MGIPWNREWKQVEGYEYEDLIYEKKYLDTGGIARISINRPDKLNAYTGTTIRHMWECVYDINADPSIGVVILTGVGDKAFCTGGDVGSEAEGALEDQIMTNNNEMLLALKVPTIAVVKGWAVGGGNHLAYCCNFTIAAENARFAQNGPRVGSPACGWTIQQAIEVIGPKKANEMWMLCRRYNAQEALEMGLVNVVAPLDKLDEEVDKWSSEILEKCPTCIRVLKATFDDHFSHRRHDRQLDTQRRLYPKFQGCAEQKEAQQAFFEKRTPNFTQYIKKEYEEYERTRKKTVIR